MLIRFKDLITLDLVASDGSRHRVEDVFLAGEDVRIVHVAANFGGQLSGRRAVVPIGRLGEPDVANTAWPCDLDEAGLGEMAGEGTTPPELPEGKSLYSAASWINRARVHCTDEEAGGLMDVIFEPKLWQLRYLVIGTGSSGLPRHQRVVEANRVEDIGFVSGRVSLALTRKDVHKALDLHDLDDVEGKWYNKVLAYYGISAIP